MASKFIRPIALPSKKKLLQDDLEKRKQQNTEEYDAQSYMDYVKSLTPTMQNVVKNQAAKAAVSTQTLRPSVPSLKDYDYYLARQNLLATEKLISQNRAAGLYNTEQVAYNPDMAYLPSTDYLKLLQEGLNTQLEASRAQDEQKKANQSQYGNDLEDWYLNLDGNKVTDWDLKALDTIKNGREYASSYELSDDERRRLTDEYMQLVAQMHQDYRYESQTPALQAKWDALDKELSRRNTGYQELASELRSSPTFLTDSVYTPMTGESYVDYRTGMGFWGQVKDQFDTSNDLAIMYDYMMNPTYASEYEAANNYQGHTSGTPYMQRGLDLLSDDEKLEAAAAMAQGEETFTRWLSSFEATGTLTRRRAMLDKAQQENLALHPVTAVPMWGATRMANLASGMLAPFQGIAAMTGNTDPNSPLYATNRLSQNVSAVQSEAAGELLPWQVPFTDQKLGSFLYNGASSIADFAVARGIGGSGKATTAITQYVMSSQAASNTIYNALKEGMDPTEAVVRGVVSGAIEAFTEKYSIEALLKNPKSIMAFIGQNMLTEGAEEGASTVLNTVADGFISSLVGRESELESEYNSLLAQGVGEQEASKQVLENFLRGLGGDVLLGGLTGGTMGAGVGTQVASQQSKTGSEIANLGNVSKLVDIGVTMQLNGESRALAEGIKKSQDAGKKVSNRQVGRLYETMYRELDEQSRQVVTDTMRDAVAERMVELGDTPKVAQEAAGAVLAVVRNEKPSLGQRQSMARAQSSTQVIKEMMYADDTTSEGRVRHSEWVRTADEKAVAASASALRQMGEIRATRVGQEATDKAVQRASVNAQKLVAEKATDKKSMEATLEDGQSAEILRVSNASGEAKVTVKAADGKEQTVSASALRLKSKPVAKVIAYIDETSERMSDEQANLLLHTYTGGDAATHIADFNAAYAAGFMARELPPSKRMDRRVAQQIAEQGRKDAEAAEEQRIKTIGSIVKGRQGKVTFEQTDVEKTLSQKQKDAVQAIKQIAKVTGINFEFYESQADKEGNFQGEQGSYNVQTGTIRLDLNAGRNSVRDLAEPAILRTAAHELTHFIEHGSKEGYAALRSFVQDELTRRGQDFDSLVREKLDNSAAAGQFLTRAGAVSEVIADASEMMLRDTKAIERLAQKDQSLMERIKGFIRDFMTKIKRAFEGIGPAHREAQVMMQELVQEFQEKWDVALVEAVEQGPDGEQMEADGEVKQYSLRDSSGNVIDLSHEEVEQNKQYVANMASVVTLEGNPMEAPPEGDFFTAGSAYFKSIGGKAENPVLGTVALNEKGIRHLINRKLSWRKTALLRAVKPVIEKGRILHVENDHNNKDTAIIAATVELDGTKYYMGVVVSQNKELGNVYEVHDAVFVQKKKKAVNALTKTPSADNNQARRGDDAPSIAIILSQLADYNREFEEMQNSLRDTPSISTREYITAMDPTDRMTDSEKWLLGKYQRTAEELRQKEADLAEQIRLSTEADSEDERTQAANRAKILRTQVNRLRSTLNQAENAEGFATIMRTSSEVVNNYIAGRNAGQVADAADALDADLEQIRKDLTAVAADINKAEDGWKAAYARGLFNPAALTNAANTIRRNYNLRMTTKALVDRLALAYAEMYANEGSDGHVRFYNAMQDLARDILSVSRNRYRSTILDMLRENVGTLSLSETQEQELKKAGISMSEFKRVVNPVVKVSKGNASDLSAIVSSAEYYGTGLVTIFSESDSEGDMILKLYNVIQEERAKERDGAFEGMSTEESIKSIVLDIMGDTYLPLAENDEAIQTLRTELLKGIEGNRELASKVDKAIESSKRALKSSGAIWRKAADVESAGKKAVAYYRAIDEQRRLLELQEQKQEITKQLRSKAAQEILAEQTRYRQMIATDREIRKKTREAAKIQGQIADKVKKLDHLRRHETDYKNVPEAFKPAVDTLVSMFADNFGTMVFDKNRAERLSTIYHKLATVDGDSDLGSLLPYYDPDVDAMLGALAELAERDAQLRTTSGRTRAEQADLRLAINKDIHTIVDHITKIVTDAQNLFYAGKKAKFAAIGTQIGNELNARADKKTLAGKAGQALNVMDNLIRTGNMTPVYFFKQLGNKVLSTLWDDLRQGQNQFAFSMRDGRETVQSLQAQHHYWDWANKKGDRLEITTAYGRKLTFTREQALWLYATHKREMSNEIAATKHLTEGGIVYEGKAQEGGKLVTTVKATPAKLTEGDIARVVGWLTDEQKAYADGMVAYLSEDMAELGNKASMEMFGIRKYTESYYFPYKTAGDQLYQSSTSGRTDTTNDARLKHTSFTHALTQGASAPLVMGDFSTAVEDHIARMATYASFVLPIESMNRVLNHKIELEDGSRATVRSMIEQKYGEPAKKYIATLLSDLNGGVRNDNRSAGMDYFVRMFKKGAVSASLSTALQQPTSLFRAMAMISPKYIAASTFSKRDWDELMQFSGTAVIKDMGRFDTDVGRSNIDWLHKKHPKGFMEWTDFISGYLPGKLDQMTWAHLWNAVKREQAAENPGMDPSSEEFLALCGERFNDIVDHTQVYDSILSRSQLMRGKDAMSKMATSFMSEPTLTINMLYDAAVNIGKPGGKAYAAKAFASVMTSSIAAAAMAAIAQAWNDDDDKRTAATKYLDKFVENTLDNINPLTMIPYVQDVYSMFQGFDVQRADMSVFAELQKAIQRFQNDSYSPYRKVEELAGTIAKFFGLPLKNVMRELRRGYNLFKSSFEAPSAYELSTIWPFADEQSTTDVYEDLFQAIQAGDKTMAGNIRDYLTRVMGKDPDKIDANMKSALSSKITQEYKPQLIALVEANKMKEAASLQAEILDAYVALGYDREKKLKDVKKWYSK